MGENEQRKQVGGCLACPQAQNRHTVHFARAITTKQPAFSCTPGDDLAQDAGGRKDDRTATGEEGMRRASGGSRSFMWKTDASTFVRLRKQTKIQLAPCETLMLHRVQDHFAVRVKPRQCRCAGGPSRAGMSHRPITTSCDRLPAHEICRTGLCRTGQWQERQTFHHRDLNPRRSGEGRVS